MTRIRFAALTRHFARAIVAPPLLTDLGVDYLRRTVASLLAILIVSGSFLTRAMFKKYVDLHVMWDDVGFLRAVEADTLLLIALPMLVVGLLTIVVAPMLFPDETDYRTLAHLPISRFEIFAAKFAAVALVATTAIVAVNVVISLWFPFAVGARVGHQSPWISNTLLPRVVAHTSASLAGSAWTFGAVMALQGLCLSLVPWRRRRQAGVVLQGAMFVALLISLPFVARFPALDVSNDRVSQTALAWIPPVWFLGVNRWTIDPTAEGYASVARIAALAGLVVATLIVVSYAYLYRRAETLAFATVAARRTAAARRHERAPVARLRWLLPQPTLAVMSFAVSGLRSSRLHQFVFLLVIGVGVAILLGQWLTVIEGGAFLGYRPRQPLHTVIAAPLLLGLSVTLALRASFLLPLDLEAAWVFKLTERPEDRPRELDAVAWLLMFGAAVPALALAVATQPAVLGFRALPAATLTTLAILVLVEVVLRDWSRVPFTCSYLPGKRVLAYTLGVLLGTYFVFVYIGATLIRAGLASTLRTTILGAVLLASYLLLRRTRLQSWGKRPLEFEDEDPLAIRTLNLLPDERTG